MLSHWMRGDPILSHQGLGAFTVLVLFGLWNARGHLLQVWRKAVGRGSIHRRFRRDSLLSGRGFYPCWAA